MVEEDAFAVSQREATSGCFSSISPFVLVL